MTDEEIEIAVAKLHGWLHRLATLEYPVEYGGMRLPNAFGPEREAWWIIDQPAYPGVYIEPPRYLSNLVHVRNAEEAVLKTTGHWITYLQNLGIVLVRDNNAKSCWDISMVRETDYKAVAYHIAAFMRANNRQRCEALLRTFGQWPDFPEDLRPWEKYEP
jgi:hypothetical protein